MGLKAWADETFDPKPVVKLFTPDGPATWLLAYLPPDSWGVAFGLCDLGVSCPELGDVELSELAGTTGHMGLAVERDRSFKASKTLLSYATDAYLHGSIRA